MLTSKNHNRNLAILLKKGGIAVIPTDTLYGIVVSALNRAAVENLYTIKKRDPQKPYIILISSLEDLELFGIKLSPSEESIVSEYWPGPVSIILECDNEEFAYLHRGKHSLAFRMPAKDSLRELLKYTGPLVAPSANPEGQPPAKTIDQAVAYFGDSVAEHVAGEITDRPSKIIKLTDGEVEILRS